MNKQRVRVGQQSLMCLKALGSRMASHMRWRYLMWLLKLQMRELKMQLREYLRRKRLLIMRMQRAYLQSIHSPRRSAMVFIVFFISTSQYRKSQKGTPVCLQICATRLWYFQMKLIMALPQFFGMFFVSFFPFFSLSSGSSSAYLCPWLFSSQETPFSCPIIQDFSLKRLQVTSGIMGVLQACTIRLSLSSRLMMRSNMVVLSLSWGEGGKMSSSLTSQCLSFCYGAQLWLSTDMLKRESSPGLMSTDMLEMLESKLSPFIRFINYNQCLYPQPYQAVYPPSCHSFSVKTYINHQRCRSSCSSRFLRNYRVLVAFSRRWAAVSLAVPDGPTLLYRFVSF